jgi:DNA-directed RNA polymerase subunit M/transcription elongation factor TFIIS
MDRQKGKEALACVLTNCKNISIIETLIYTLYTDSYETILYDTIGDILSKKKLNDIVGDLKQKKIGFDHAFFEEENKQFSENENFLECPFEISNTLVQCGKCKQHKVYVVQKQVRSADEPMTSFYTCIHCKNKWKI